MINQQRRDNKKHYKVYFFQMNNGKIGDAYQCKTNDEMYEKNKKGFYRRVNVSSFLNHSRYVKGEVYEDQFSIDFNNSSQSHNGAYKPRRLWDAYEKQQPIFSNFTEQTESFMDYSRSYTSFASEFGLIDKVYLQTIFLTKRINPEGYYQYFVRRNGQFYLQCIDDVIPVEGLHRQPIWGLSFSCPWQLLLLKAWIKEKRGLGALTVAEPFEFLYCFGLPGYSAKNIKKELDFLKKQHSELELKRKKQQKLPLNRPQFNILAKTRTDDKIQQLGLMKNCLGYKVIPIKPSKSLVSGSKNSQRTIYKVRSTVPSKWIGSLSVVNKHQNLSDYNFGVQKLNLQKQFLATEEQILTIFSKFYIARDYHQQYQQNRVFQDSYIIDNAQKDVPTVFRLQVFEQGIMNINIDFKQSSKRIQFIKGTDRIRWPYIKYFLAKVDKSEQVSKSGFSTQKNAYKDFQPNLFKYNYYDIQFMKGYHRSVNRFMKMQKGDYYIYVKIQNISKGVPQIDYAINISSSAKFQQLQVQHLNPFQLRQLIDSTIFDYSKIHGQRYIGRNHIEYIYLGNTFRQIGFGFMALELRQRNQLVKSTNNKSIKKSNVSQISPQDVELGIRIYPEKFKKLKLAGYYYQERDGTISRIQQSNLPISMISRFRFPKIIVFENPNYNIQLNQDFPEPGSVDVYLMKKKR